MLKLCVHSFLYSDNNSWHYYFLAITNESTTLMIQNYQHKWGYICVFAFTREESPYTYPLIVFGWFIWWSQSDINMHILSLAPLRKYERGSHTILRPSLSSCFSFLSLLQGFRLQSTTVNQSDSHSSTRALLPLTHTLAHQLTSVITE